MSRTIQPEDFGLSQHQFDEIKTVFDQFDNDASGAIPTGDVAAAMRKLGQPVDDQDEVLGMTIGTVDPEGSGHIGLNEFLVIMTQSHLGYGDAQDGVSEANTGGYVDEGGAGTQGHKSQANLPPELAAEDQAVQDFLRILDEHRRHCEREGKYIEAETASRRLKELRQHEENRRREAMRSRQTAERLGIEEAHMLEFEQFNAIWEQRMQEYEKSAEEGLEKLKEKHLAEILAFQEEWQNKLPRKPKLSKELLNMRKIQDTLARQERYQEAQKIKFKADEREAWELARLQDQLSQTLAAKEQRIRQKQHSELTGLAKRIQRGREEYKGLRQSELERRLQRYKNVKDDLTSKQNIETNSFNRLMASKLKTDKNT
eukprot:TRINITY_DN3938_c0_g1_i10.p1 TRINITY_DN3938_c0_g1~~TRINITY_DN3938_c0_g1_i10.p1  ORF type:complete len:372 (-),score=108.14 TRINITY_DN3938_c0_g1_i10:379-1494(-)